jgi:iron complex outermembrane receptor protein
LTNNLTTSYQPRAEYDALNALAEVSYDFAHWLQADLGTDIELADETIQYYTTTTLDPSRPGAFVEEDLLPSTVSPSRDYLQLGTYLQLRSAPLARLPDLRFTGSARADWISFGPYTYPLQTSFRGAMAYRFSPRFAARLIGGRAFQVPSGLLLFSRGGFGTAQNVFGTERLGSPRPLIPQVVTSAEIVASSQIADFLSLEASAFYQELDDAIRFNRDGIVFGAKNSGSVTSAGGELIANLHFGRVRPYAAASTSTQLSAELTRDLRDLASFTASPSMYPRLFGYVGCDFDLIKAKLFLNAELWWAGERGGSQANFYENNARVYSLPAYKLLDMTLSTGRLPILDRDLGTRFSLSVRNALSEDHNEPGFAGVDIPQPRTTLGFQVRQEL